MMTRSPFLILLRFSTFAKRQTSRCSCWYVRVRLSPGSPSQIIAALFPRKPSGLRCRSRQFSEMFSFPPTNHFAKGAFLYRTFFHLAIQTSSLASRAENFPGGLMDSRDIRLFHAHL